MILPVHGTRVSVLPLINFSFFKITVFFQKFSGLSETRISRYVAVSILQLVQLSAPLGWPLRNDSPPQKGGEAPGGQACIIWWSEWITAQAATRSQLLLHCSPNGCTVLMC